jgi:ribosomal protein S12 methylthiotransferase
MTKEHRDPEQVVSRAERESSKQCPQTVAVVTLGCPKNLVDSEVLMAHLESNGLRLTDADQADTIIINTCGFIEAAKQESIDAILEAVELKNSGRTKRVLVAGCLSERYAADLVRDIPEVDGYFGVTDFPRILASLGSSFGNHPAHRRHLTTPPHTAYLKISEGCDHPCAFCAIPIIRGKHVSRRMEDIVDEARELAAGGVKELVVIGQDTTYYGRDLYGRRKLADLLERLCSVDGVAWVRLMYTYPSHFPEDVLHLMASEPKLCSYIDMPIQHIDDAVLRSMRRGISSTQTRKLIEKIRRIVPGVALRSTIIAGYPGETDKAFERLMQFVEETGFERLGVFSYSTEDGTAAEPLGDPVPASVKEERRAALMELQQDISYANNAKRVGSVMNVLFDEVEGDFLIGRTEYDAPEIDNSVLVSAKGNVADRLIGNFFQVRIEEAMEFDLRGTIV